MKNIDANLSELFHPQFDFFWSFKYSSLFYDLEHKDTLTPWLNDKFQELNDFMC